MEKGNEVSRRTKIHNTAAAVAASMKSEIRWKEIFFNLHQHVRSPGPDDVAAFRSFLCSVLEQFLRK